jgi:hypothetical protein
VQPVSTTVQPESFAHFNVGVAGAPRPALQWRFNGEDIFGATNSFLNVIANLAAQGGRYSVVASNVFGAITSQVATLTILFAMPNITQQPISQGTMTGGFASFTVQASGAPPPTYQWRFNGENIVGANSYWLNRPDVTLQDAGEYTVVASNVIGSVTSRVAFLDVSVPGSVDHWRWRHPKPQGNDLFAVAYGNGRYVAVGDRGLRVFSTNGIHWQAAHSPESNATIGSRPRGVAYGKGLFVAVGDLGIETSTNGIDWQAQAWFGGDFEYLNDVKFGQGRFMAVGTGGLILISSDGLSWSARNFATFHQFTGASIGTDGFAAITRTGNVFVSRDDEQWSSSTIWTGANGAFTGIAYRGGRLVAVGYYWIDELTLLPLVFSSADGLTWGNCNISGQGGLYDIVMTEELFVAVGGHNSRMILTSPNGIDWSSAASPPGGELYGVTHSEGRFAAVGNFGAVLTSSDGLQWAAPVPVTSRNLRDVVRVDDRYVAVGNEGLFLTSTNGTDWTERSLGTTNNLRGVAWGNGRFVIVGNDDDSGAKVAISQDGAQWSLRPIASQGLYAITFAYGLFIAVGEDRILTSPDGFEWTARYTHPSANRLNAIVNGRGRLFAVGRKGMIVTSTNGVNWVPVSPLADPLLRDVFFQAAAYGNGVFVAAGQQRSFAVSSNGVDWVRHERISGDDIEDITFAAGMFIAVGEDGLVLTSSNGITWTPHDIKVQSDLRAVIYEQGRLLAVGDNETVLQSAHLAPASLRLWRQVTPPGLSLTIEGETNRQYRLQGSSNLTHWADLLNFTLPAGMTNYFDPVSIPRPSRFYRAVSP